MMTLQMGIVFLLLLGLSAALVCPDGGMCADKNTCCRNNQGGYSCCPLPHAECCSDHLHCCYEGTVCDLAREKCVNKTVSLPWMSRLPTKQAPLSAQFGGRAKAVVCPDQQSECPDDTTCCQLPDGSWGCCPLPKAVCCEDKRHCCPEGTKCDVARAKCVSGSLKSFPMLQKVPAKSIENDPASSASVKCPGGKSSCPDGYTCCLLTSGDYGCCPYPEATCCSDHLHCCPSNTICDLEHLACRSGASLLPLMKNIPAAVGDVVCPDKKSACPDQTSCCQLTNGTYGCCPLPNAVCCADHAHCCPARTTCDLSHSSCMSTQGDARTPMKPLAAAGTDRLAVQSQARAVPCNDSVACADGSTCCKSSTGEWACCPLPKAVCCEDHLHCCPHGTVCNLAASTCDDPRGGAAIPLFPKTPALPTPEQNSKCDRSTSCPGKATCCRTASGDWACCPLPQAVCCEDHTHCCPHATVCNLQAETCDDPSGASPPLPWQQKGPALSREEQQPVALQAWPDRNMCDSQTSCPRDTTCCFMATSRKWGCCPLPKAVCCVDGDHCCPSGHTCEPHRSSCSRGPRLLPWVSKLSARTEAAGVADVKCDNKSSCAAGTTCCKLQSGEWGCCPLVKAVCCADREHCCPQGYTCNMQTGTCEKTASVLLPPPRPLSAAVRSGPGGSQQDVHVPCDGAGQFHCPKHHTCCKISATEWSCCPSPAAVCCHDSKHCCPAGYSCDLRAGGCTLQARLTWDALLRDRKKDSVPPGL